MKDWISEFCPASGSTSTSETIEVEIGSSFYYEFKGVIAAKEAGGLTDMETTCYPSLYTTIDGPVTV